MNRHVLFLCGDCDASDAGLREADFTEIKRLDAGGSSPSLVIEFVGEKFAEVLPLALIDLLELASYVYAADRLVTRGGDDVSGRHWIREITLVIAVRDSSRWTPPVVEALTTALGWLTEDKWHVLLVPTRRTTAQQTPVLHDSTFRDRTCVALFSGGLDSLGGAMWDVRHNGHRPVLVSHRTTGVVSSRQQRLMQALATGGDAYVQIQSWVHLTERDKETTQRSRSFLFLSLAVVVARQFELPSIHVFENGTLSVNLPISSQVVGTHASRTTHPRFIQLMNRLVNSLFGGGPLIDLPFFELTKAEIVKTIDAAGLADLIPLTVSCAHVEGQTRVQPHCGVCSQCVDRRFAVASAHLIHMDPTYARNIFIDSMSTFPKPALVRALVHGYVTTYRRAGQLSTEGLLAEFPELLDLVGAVPTDVLRRLEDLFRRQRDVVNMVLEEQISQNAQAFLDNTLPADSALRLIVGNDLLREPETRLAERIAETARRSLPVAFKSKSADSETQVRHQLEVALAGQKLELDSEFPQFLRIVGVGAKPDLSDTRRKFFVELKFPRRSRPLRVIVEEIDADITKYAGQADLTLFLIYDPEGQIPDLERFQREVEKNGPGIICRVVR